MVQKNFCAQTLILTLISRIHSREDGSLLLTNYNVTIGIATYPFATLGFSITAYIVLHFAQS